MEPRDQGTPAVRRRLWPWRRRRSRLSLALAGLPLALVLAWPAAPVEAAAPATVNAAGLCLLFCGPAASPTPTVSAPSGGSGCILGLVCIGSGSGKSASKSGPCVLGVVLCGGNVLSQPSPCVAGTVLCGPLPASPCVAGVVLCPGTIIGPGTPSPRPTASATGSPNPGNTGGGPPTGANAAGGGATTTAVSLLGLPGVGLVPEGGGGGSTAAANVNPNPDAFSELLSLSIRDGLNVGGYQLWPLLAALQVLLLLAVVGAFSARRVLEASKLPGN